MARLTTTIAKTAKPNTRRSSRDFRRELPDKKRRRTNHGTKPRSFNTTVGTGRAVEQHRAPLVPPPEKPWLDDNRYIVSLEGKKVEIKVGDSVFHGEKELFLIVEVALDTGELLVQPFDRINLMDNLVDANMDDCPFILSKELEYILAHDTASERWSYEYARSIVNKANMLPWQTYASGSHDQRAKSLFCRFARARVGSLDVVCCGTDFKPSKPFPEESVKKWSECACGCRAKLDLDQSWSYCTNCMRTTQDRCITNDGTVFLREIRRGQDWVFEVVEKDNSRSRVAQCPNPECSAEFKFRASENEVMVHFGHPLTGPSDRFCEILIDAGTDRFRTSMDFGPITHRTRIHDAVPSRVFIPADTTEVQTIRVGRYAGSLAPSSKGMMVFPIKKLILHSGDLRQRFLQNDVRLGPDTVFTQTIRSMQHHFHQQRSEMCRASPIEDNFTVATAFPAIFNQHERARFLTGMLHVYPTARIVAVPEPVAAFYHLANQEPRAPGHYLVFDIGATTLDIAWLYHLKTGEIKVVHDLGFELGADWAETATYNSLEQHDTARDFNWKNIKMFGSMFKETNKEPAEPIRLSSNDDIGPIYKEKWSDYLAEIDEKVGRAFDDVCVDGCMIVKPTVASLVTESRETGNPLTLQSVIMCGGGSASADIRDRIARILATRSFHHDLEVYPANPNHSVVSQGLEIKLKTMRENPMMYSPVTVCFEQQTRGARDTSIEEDAIQEAAVDRHRRASSDLSSSLLSTRSNDGSPDRTRAASAAASNSHHASTNLQTELVVLLFKDQALSGTKLLSAQLLPAQLLFFDTDLDPEEDSLLTFKAAFSIPSTSLNTNRFLVARPTAEDCFYNCAEVRVPKENWSSVASNQKALTAMQVTLDMDAGVVFCAGIMYSLHTWKVPTTRKAYDVLNEEIDDEIGMCEKMTLDEVTNRAKNELHITVHAEFKLAGSLNLNESNNQSSRFR